MGTSAKGGVAALVIGIVASAAVGFQIDDWTDLISVYFFGALILMVAGVVTFWIFGLPRDVEDQETKRPSLTDARRLMDTAQALTTAYSKVLQTPRDRFWPLSKLPADKEAIKAALKFDAAFQASQGELDKPIGGGKTTLRDLYIGIA